MDDMYKNIIQRGCMDGDLQKKLNFLQQIKAQQPPIVNNVIGLTFQDALAILFIAFKLAGIIGWNWGFVLLPVYGPILIKVAVNWWKVRKQNKVV